MGILASFTSSVGGLGAVDIELMIKVTAKRLQIFALLIVLRDTRQYPSP
jgi:hypothetical protein